MLKNAIFSVIPRRFASHNRIKPFRKPFKYPEPLREIIGLRDRGFLRSNKPYEPPSNVKEIIAKAVSEIGGVKNFQQQKFELLKNCFAAFNHSVPNSLLFEIKSLDDVIDFYSVPVDVKTPYEKLVQENDLPNLHLVPEHRRFNPEEDGVSAFPKSSNLVTGLKYRKKYKSHIAKTSWP